MNVSVKVNECLRASTDSGLPEFQEAEEDEKEDLRCLLKQELGKRGPFTAFKRWLIRDHREAYPELFCYIDSH
ncbi:MAG: hypothetical protein HFI76_12465 [Lachnospiraceae bacterium]|nr:hypothetical protein [Lachnospiraceae bacterium]